MRLLIIPLARNGVAAVRWNLSTSKHTQEYHIEVPYPHIPLARQSTSRCTPASAMFHPLACRHFSCMFWGIHRRFAHRL